jgi:hypothetical protein
MTALQASEKSTSNSGAEQARTHGVGKFMNRLKSNALTAFPDSAWAIQLSLRRVTLLAGIRAGGDNLCRLPSRLFKATSGNVGQGETA